MVASRCAAWRIRLGILWFGRLRMVLSAAILAALTAAAWGQGSDDYWPQWRGPRGTGVAPHAKPPRRWDAQTNIAWKVPIPGDGTSTPIIWENLVFVQTAVPARDGAAAAEQGAVPLASQAKRGPGQGAPGKTPPPGRGGFPGKGPKGGFGGAPLANVPYRWMLLCLDRRTGKTLWEKVAREEVPHEGFRPGDGSFAASSALTDGQRVYAFFGSRGLYCYDLAGKLLWEKDLGDQQTRNGFGEGATPALWGDMLVVPWDHEGDDFIVALDKHTGRELWRQSRDEPTCWSTPLIVEHKGQAQVIACGTNRVISYDLATGRPLWELEGLTANVIPTGVAAGDIVFLTSGFRGSKLLAVRLGKTGDLTGSEAVLWRYDQDTPYVPSPLLSENRLYFFKSNNAILSCLDATTGKPFFAAQRIGELGSTVYASPIAADGHVYLVGRNGTTVVIKDAPQLEVVATNVLNDPIDASPAAVGTQLFLRSRTHLYCLQAAER